MVSKTSKFETNFFVAAIIFILHLYDTFFCELFLNAFHFYRFIQSDDPNQKYIKAASIRKDHITVKKTENGVREGENLIQGSLICLTRLILRKVLL